MGKQNGSICAGADPARQAVNAPASAENTINTPLPTNKEEL